MTPSKPSSLAQQAWTTAGDSVAGRFSSSAGTSTCAVMIAATPASMAARNGRTRPRAADPAGARPAAARGANRCWCRRGPGSACRTRPRPRPAAPGRSPRPSRATSSACSASARSPITGFFGLVWMSRTGAKSSVMPTALSSRRQRRGEPRGERIRPRAPERRHRRPAVKGAFSRATRPPSWSTLTQAGSSGPSLRLGGQLRDLLRRLDVAREQDDAAQIELARQRAQLRRDRCPGEAGNQQLPDIAVVWPAACVSGNYNCACSSLLPRRRASTSPAAPSTSGRSISSTGRADAERRHQPARARPHRAAPRRSHRARLGGHGTATCS